jgi:uncharacterized membrane protein YhaH (DUF805 family)
MQNAHNPYAPPKTEVNDIIPGDITFQSVKIFSTAGRIGRMRLLAYTFCSYMCLFLFIFSLEFFGIQIIKSFENDSDLSLLIMLIPVIIINFLWCIQRSHDINLSGWSAIVVLVMPIAWIYWVIMPGTVGNNRFGAQPVSNNLVINILGTLGILSNILLGVSSFL